MSWVGVALSSKKFPDGVKVGDSCKHAITVLFRCAQKPLNPNWVLTIGYVLSAH